MGQETELARHFPIIQSFFDKQTVGRWTEFGTKKVYHTTQLSLTVDRRLVATASHFVGCVFDVVANKQLLCGPYPVKASTVGLRALRLIVAETRSASCRATAQGIPF